MCFKAPDVKMPPPPPPPPQAPPPPEKPPEVLEDAVDSTATALKKQSAGTKRLRRGNKSGMQIGKSTSTSASSGLKIS